MGINVDNLMKDGDRLYAVVITTEGNEITLCTAAGTFKITNETLKVKQGWRVYFNANGEVDMPVDNKAKPSKSSTSGSAFDRNHALANMAQ